MKPRRSTRLRRRAGEPIEPFYVDLSPEVTEKIGYLSARLNIPKWAVIETAIRAAELGPDGVPTGWTLPQRGEELPIDIAA